MKKANLKLTLYLSEDNKELVDRAKELLKDSGSLSQQFIEFVKERVRDKEHFDRGIELIKKLLYVRAMYNRYPNFFSDLTIPDQVAENMAYLRNDQITFDSLVKNMQEIRVSRANTLDITEGSVENLYQLAREVLAKATTKPEE